MLNPSLAKILYEMGDLLEMGDDNPFRIRAFRRAAEIIESFPQDLGALSREQQLQIPGIGKGIADLIEELKKKGSVAEHQRLLKKFPEGLLQIMRLQGLGPKRAAILYKERRIDSIDKLSAAAKKGTLRTLHGFGPKMESNILKGISFAAGATRLLITQAHQQAEEMKAHLKTSPVIKNLELAGSARRWKETVGDLDFVCTSKSPEKAIAHFLRSPGAGRVLAEGTTKASVVLRSGLQCDFRVVPALSFGAALLYFTGSKEHNVRLRELALKKGLTLNEYGLFRLKDEKQAAPEAGRTEEEIYRRLGLAWIPPELREDRGEIEAARNDTLPRLVTEKDIQGDFHNHTTLSDGKDSVEAMVEAARARGWSWYFCGDHSPSLKVASGLPAAAVRAKMAQLKKLDGKSGLRVFCGSEVDILADGALDYPEDILEELGCVVASVHTRFSQPEAEMTERICRALKSPHADILGHISGRLINRRESYNINYETILQTAKNTRTAIEINGQPDRQELNDSYVKRAIELGIPLAVNTDAHSTYALDQNMTVAVHIARRGWAEPRHLLNCLSTETVLEWLKS